MSNPTVPLKEISGQKLSNEQTAYLDGFFSGLKNRGVSFGDIMPNPAAQPTSSKVCLGPRSS